MSFLRSVVLLFSFLFIFSGCSDQKENQDVLSQEEMVKILIKIHLAEGTVSQKNLLPDSARQLYRETERKLFEDLGVDKLYYNKSFKYYVSQPELMDNIYSAVVDSLSLREATGNLN